MQVPLDRSRETTLEDPAVTSPSERERRFGQWDHVRVYGRDYPARLREAGFAVSAIRYAAELPAAMALGCGLDPQEEIFRCSKPGA